MRPSFILTPSVPALTLVVVTLSTLPPLLLPHRTQLAQSGEKKCVNVLRASAFVPWLSAVPPVVRAGVYSTGTDRTNSPLRVLLRSLSHLTSRLFHPSRARLEGRHPTTPVVRPWKLCSAERPRAAPPSTVC